MEFTVLKTKVVVSPLFFAVLTAFFITDRNGIAIPAVLFSFLHECGHFLALLCAKTRPKAIKLSAFGIEMQLYENMSTGEKIFVLMAGFLVNYVLSAVCFLCGKTVFGFINLFLGIFTSLPIGATDGGTVLKNVFDYYCSEKTYGIISVILSLLLALVLSALALYSKNYYLFFAIIYIIVSIKK